MKKLKNRKKTISRQTQEQRKAKPANMFFYPCTSPMLLLFTILVAGILGVFSILNVSGSNQIPRNGQSLDPILYTYKIVKRYPHDSSAFTQGLIYYNTTTLYESIGLYGRSSVREVHLQSGSVRKEQQNAFSVFGEGLVLVNERLLQVTWQTQRGFIFNRSNLAQVGTFQHPMTDGWGLTKYGPKIIGSDGTSKLYTMDPNNFTKYSTVTVRDNGVEVKNLNELEIIKGNVWANVWLTDCIAIINRGSGTVKGWLYAPGLRQDAMKASNGNGIDVLNGIAWDEKNDRIFVTGKLWPRLYEIKLVAIMQPTAAQLKNVRQNCIPTN